MSVFFTSHLWFDLRSPMMTSGEKKQRLKKKKAKTFIISKKKKKNYKIWTYSAEALMFEVNVLIIQVFLKLGDWDAHV